MTVAGGRSRASRSSDLGELRELWCHLYRATPCRASAASCSISDARSRRRRGPVRAAASAPPDRGEAAAIRTGQDRSRSQLKPVTRLMREWRGRTHEVLVLDEGFSWQGTRYRSLLLIARPITGDRVAWAAVLRAEIEPIGYLPALAGIDFDRPADGRPQCRGLRRAVRAVRSTPANLSRRGRARTPLAQSPARSDAHIRSQHHEGWIWPEPVPTMAGSRVPIWSDLRYKVCSPTSSQVDRHRCGLQVRRLTRALADCARLVEIFGK
jgi:Protein of unknown function (DUF2924)